MRAGLRTDCYRELMDSGTSEIESKSAHLGDL